MWVESIELSGGEAASVASGGPVTHASQPTNIPALTTNSVKLPLNQIITKVNKQPVIQTNGQANQLAEQY